VSNELSRLGRNLLEKLVEAKNSQKISSLLLGKDVQYYGYNHGSKCAGIPCWNFFLFQNFIPALIIMYYIYLSFSVSLTVCPCFAFKKYTGTFKFPFRALVKTVPLDPILGQIIQSKRSQFLTLITSSHLRLYPVWPHPFRIYKKRKLW
jgi:hypothetical protein